MQFCSLDATFGKLERREIIFSPGLNIIEAPNESGKSTLCAFLRTMLYGLKTGERGALADKNRYAPWSGSPMRGTLSLITEQGPITLQRSTVRANAPMGSFSALYTGTGDSVSGLTAADCGEQLLGVSREVYERSAFIRQSGLAIDSDAELERRIAALITTGEEGSSYSETVKALKKQLNSHRHNKSGQIPALEQSISEDASALSELQVLESQHKSAETGLAELQAEQTDLKRKLSLHDAADQLEQLQALRETKHAAEDADAKAEAFYRTMLAEKTPPREVLEQSRAKLHTLEELIAQRTEVEKKRSVVQTELAEFDATAQRKRTLPIISVVMCIAAALSALGAVLFACRPLTVPTVMCGILCAACAAAAIYLRRRDSTAVLAQQHERSLLADAVSEAEAACAALNAAYTSQSDALLTDIPVADVSLASAYITDALSRRETHQQLVREAQMAQMQYEFLQKHAPKNVPEQTVKRPAHSREELRRLLSENAARCSELQRTADYTAGRIRAIGDRADFENALIQKRSRLGELEMEYEAIALAMDSLERANTILQNRFSPALGARAAELFSQLTDGKYQKVLLDRSFKAFAEESGLSVSRDAALLSQGAADQLYLAVRLAICELVLPAEKNIPLILDDALINFDDTRCAAALELLLKKAENRQILLFTCQRRESAYLAGREGVTLLSL